MPPEEYIAYLVSVDDLEFYAEISCGDLFEGNGIQERIVIFKII